MECEKSDFFLKKIGTSMSSSHPLFLLLPVIGKQRNIPSLVPSFRMKKYTSDNSLWPNWKVCVTLDLRFGTTGAQSCIWWDCCLLATTTTPILYIVTYGGCCFCSRVDVHRKDNVGSLEKAITIYGNPDNCTNACRRILEVMQQEANNTNKG